MRVLVTGASGMLGSDVCEFAVGRGHEVVPVSRQVADVTDLAAVNAVVGEHRPDLVVHAAAFVDADAGERDPEPTYRANVAGTWNVALACARFGAQLVYVSSCGVFDGQKAAPYTELDTPNPLNHHHRSKLEGERIVASLVHEHFILRPGWLFGGRAEHRRNFVQARHREAAGKAVIHSACDRFGSPTYTMDFADAALRIVETQAFGLYHVVNAEPCSRYEYVAACLSALGLPTRVAPVTSERFPRAATLPAWEALDCLYMRLRSIAPPRPWRDALLEYTRTRLLPQLAEVAE